MALIFRCFYCGKIQVKRNCLEAPCEQCKKENYLGKKRRGNNALLVEIHDRKREALKRMYELRKYYRK